MKPKTTLPAFTPVPRLKQRSNGWNAQVQHAFIEALAETGSVAAAARRVNRAAEGAYLLRRHPEAKEFRKAWQAALDIGMQRIEDVAMDRALNGVEVPVYSYGKLVGTRRIFNDRLLMFMLRNRAPKRFAGEGARGMSALDRETLARLKKAWRKQWEKEWGALQLEREVMTMKSLNAKIDMIREKEECALALESRRQAMTEEELEEEAEAERAFDAMWHKRLIEIDPRNARRYANAGGEEEVEEVEVEEVAEVEEAPPLVRIRSLKGEWD